MRICFFLLLAFGLAACSSPIVPDGPAPGIAPPASSWRQHDMDRPQPPRVEPGDPPSDAVQLITPNLDAWEHADGSPARWEHDGDALVIAPGTGSIQTQQSFGDLQLHLEWQPAPSNRTGQDRSNSGLVLMDGRYEIQILDSWESTTYADGRAAAIYGQFPPLADATRPPSEWQTYDLFFRRPRLDDSGTVIEPARLTLLHNGVLVQNNEALVGTTIWLQSLPYDDPHPESGPIQLQDHGSPVRFRSLWVRPIPARPEPPPGTNELATVTLTDRQLDRLVGVYRRPNDAYTIARRGDGLELSFPWRPEVVLPMLPLSPTRFHLAHTAGTVEFVLDDTGAPIELVFSMGGTTWRATHDELAP
ncbi:MAG: hypothetical protein Rubg2KO_18220 [Rubricoccaceae bacterium]